MRHLQKEAILAGGQSKNFDIQGAWKMMANLQCLYERTEKVDELVPVLLLLLSCQGGLSYGFLGTMTP